MLVQERPESREGRSWSPEQQQGLVHIKVPARIWVHPEPQEGSFYSSLNHWVRKTSGYSQRAHQDSI